MERRGFLWVFLAAVILLALPASASAARSLSIGNATVTEPDGANTVAAKFKVTLSKKSSKKVTADFRTSPGTATEGEDYVAKSGTVKIKPHRKSKTIKVIVKGDNADELNETFVVDLTASHGAAIANAEGVGTITDNDLTDSDGDGIPDTEDECPNVAAPDGFCPTTPYDINQGTVPNGNHVTVLNLLVTAVKTGHSPVWAQMKTGDVGYSGAQDSGLELTGSGLSDADVGDRITVKGVVSNSEVTTSSVQILSELNEPVSPVVVTPVQLSASEAYDNVYVQLQDVEISSQATGDWVLTEGPRVDNAIITGGSLGTYANGTDFTFISGIGDTAQSPDAVLPRISADISVAPPALEGFSTALSGGCIRVGDNNVPVGTVTLNYPATFDTVVTVTSDDNNAATVQGNSATVQAGMDSAVVNATGVSGPDDVTLTATLGAGSPLTAPLHVNSAATPCP
jgi:hypothetical protein